MTQAAVFSPSPVRGDRALTVDDWFTLPEDGNRYELFEGLLLLVPPPTRSHQDATGNLFYALKTFAMRTGGYAGVAPLGVALSDDVGFEPDAIYVAPGREAILGERGIEGAPDLVVEVLSPSTRTFDSGTKLRTYLEHGVVEAWLVDIEARTVTVHRTDEAAVTVAFGEPVPSRVVDIGDAGLG